MHLLLPEATCANDSSCDALILLFECSALHLEIRLLDQTGKTWAVVWKVAEYAGPGTFSFKYLILNEFKLSDFMRMMNA